MTQALPVWIVAAALWFWGSWSGALGLAFPLIVLLVAPRGVKRRFAFEPAEFHRSLDVCWVLLLGGVMLAYNQQPLGGVLKAFARWLPVVVFPAALAQAWSATGRVPASALIPLPGWRRQVDPRSTFDVMPILVAACLLAASVVGAGRPWYYAGLVAVAGAAFWSVRVRALRAPGAAFLLGLAACGGWFVAVGIGEAQLWVENRVLSLVTRLRGDDPSRRLFRTAIGEVGEVGGGSRVVLRLRGYGQGPLPRLLRVSVFTTWHDGTWFAPRAEAEKVEMVGEEWRLDRRPGREGAAFVEWVPERTQRFLPLPGSSRAIAELPATRLERTWVGAVRAETQGGVVGYRVDYGPDAEWELAPRTEDESAIPAAELPGIRAVVEAWGLSGMDPAEVVRRIGDRFEREFRYTTRLEDVVVPDIRAQTPVGRFLMGNKAGHCEYFATASVLLLRAAGVPARYVTGYSVGAGERDGNTVTVRESALHAWVRVWVNGGWRDFDPTPSGGLDGERPPLTVAERLRRAWSDLKFGFARWWWIGEKRLLRQAYWLAVPLLAGLLWRLRRVREAASGGREAAAAATATDWPGTDSEWYGLADWMDRGGWRWGRREPRDAWRSRLESGGWPGMKVDLVEETHRLHQRLRFDPLGLRALERERLRTTSTGLLEWGRREPRLNGDATRA